jgi:hypothetical protein
VSDVADFCEVFFTHTPLSLDWLPEGVLVQVIYGIATSVNVTVLCRFPVHPFTAVTLLYYIILY